MSNNKRKNTRAAKGEGTISKRTKINKKTGQTYTWWEGRVTVGWNAAGKQARRTVTGKTQAEVRKKMQTIKQMLEDHSYVELDRMTLDEWLEEWLNKYQVNTVDSTIHTYRRDVEKYISPLLGQIKLQKLSKENVAQMVASLLARGLAPKTIRCIHGVLHKALAKAVALEKLPRNVATGTELPKLGEPALHLLDHTEVATLKNAAAGFKHRRFFLLALYLGLREGELLGLNWAQINWQKHELNVDRQLVWDRGNMANKYITEPKCASRRILNMPPTVEAILKEQQEEVEFQKELAGDKWIERGLVFPGPHGDFMSRQTVYDCLQRVAKKAGLGHLRVHDLRHTFAALALEAGVDVRTVQGMLGHATPEFTLRVYAYVNDHMRKTAAQKIEVAIGKLEKIASGELEEDPEPEIIQLNA